ncbi:MAG TPA: hypothetical protein VFB59_03305 [Candidatus Saccharimonadales bacterium]|nr:hypothetical protein [Candidatus Saccharimonadales bacterium]
MVASQARENTPWARPGHKLLTPEQRHQFRQNKPLGRVAVAAVQQHAGRAAWQTQRAFGSTAEVFTPNGLPAVYADPNSTQEWTKRSFALYAHPKKFFTNSWWPRELITRALCWINGGEPSVKNIVDTAKDLPGFTWAHRQAQSAVALGKRVFGKKQLADD